MKKFLLTIASLFLISWNLISQTATQPSVGDGTAGNPYQIETLENLYWLRQNIAQWGDGLHYIQTADIDASSTRNWGTTGWNPIGNVSTSWKGAYNGKGHVISGLYIKRTTSDYSGLFGHVENSTVKNLGVIHVDFTGRQYSGGLIGRITNSVIDSCYTTGSITGTSNVGGLTGSNYGGTISYSYSTCNVSGVATVGGFVGTTSNALIKNSFSTGLVRGNASVGGFVGWNAASNDTRLCYSHSRVARTSGTSVRIGSFAGHNTSGIIYSYAAGRVTYDGATNPTNKGFIGENSGTYQNNFYDRESSLQSQGVLEATGLTTAQMFTEASYTSWNFTTTWGLVPGEYPFLLAHSFTATQPLGTGTTEDPYRIDNLENIYWLTLNLAAWDKHFIQTQDIDATPTKLWFDGRGHIPIGNSTLKFTGSYNGQGFIIDGLYIDRPSASSVGLFGHTNGAILRDLGITNATITGNTGVAVLAGNHGLNIANGSLIEYCYTTGKVYGSSFVGGIAGHVRDAEIKDSYSLCNVTRLGGTATSVGAFTGHNQDVKLRHNYSIGSVFYNNATNPNNSGFIGTEQNTNTFTHNFFDSEFSNQTTSTGATAKGTQQMKDTGTFSAWDFGTWIIEPEENNGYPFLLPYRALVVTLPVTNITATNAQTGGNILNDNGFPVTQKGVVWSTQLNPTLETNEGVTNEGTGTEEFTSNLTGLTLGTEYYTRAYSNTEKGTAYGEQISFVTLPAGDGTPENPFQIFNLTQLKWIADNQQHWDKHFIQMEDIDASTTTTWNEGAGWQTIGYDINLNNQQPFSGSYDGQNHTISGLFINMPGADYKGLFGKTLNAQIKNIILASPQITGKSYLGALAGSIKDSSIENIEISSASINGVSNLGGLTGNNTGTTFHTCSTSGTITGTGTYVGGLTGSNASSTIEESHSTCTVQGTVNVGGFAGSNTNNSLILNSSSTAGEVIGNEKAGGLAGANDNSIIEGSFRSGDVTSSIASSHTQMGGLVGTNSNGALIKNSWAIDGSVKRTGPFVKHYGISQAGGLVGLNEASTIIHCYSTFHVNNTNASAGALVGQNSNGIIIRSSSTGNVSGTSSLGGLIGLNNNTSIISDCYSRGSITIKEAFSYSATTQGGLVGNNIGSSIFNSYSTGSITYEAWGMPNHTSKGLVGADTDGIYYNNYFSLSSNQSSSVGAEGLTDAEMQLLESFEGWDFLGVWGYEAGINNDFPVIDAQDMQVVLTSQITAITHNTATVSGNALLENESPITARGFVWSNLPNPETDNNTGISAEGEGTGVFESLMEELTPGTTYYVKAYAESNTGIAYGTQISFTTETIAPGLTTKDITNITQTTAQSGGIIDSDGGANITGRGIVWSTSQNPTIDNNEGITTDGEGIGDYSSEMTDLTSGTTYYVRAYATNNIDTAYGEQKSFTTSLLPVYTLTLSTTPAGSGSATLAADQPAGPYQEGSTIQVIATPADGYEFAEWKADEVTISTTATFTYTMPANNTELTAVFRLLTGVLETRISKVDVYPNPFNETIYLLNTQNVSKITISNITGQKVMAVEGNQQSMIDTSSLNNGIYIVTIEFDNKQRQVLKMIKK